MNSKSFRILLNVFLISGSLFFIFVGLTHGKSFLIPLITAIVLAMVMAPVASRFQSWGIGKGWAVLLADLVIVLFILFVIFLFAAQANQVANNWPEIEKRLMPKVEQAKDYIENNLNAGIYDQLQQEDQKQNQDSLRQDQPAAGEQQSQMQGQNAQQQDGAQEKEQSSLPGLGQKENQGKGSLSSPLSLNSETIKSKLSGIIQNIFSIISNLLLILIYVFFFLFYSRKFRDTILGMVPEDKKGKTREILKKISETAQHYLFGRFMLIFILAVLYMIGWSILGIKYALFISILAALFSLIPYVGNIVGLFLAIAMSLLSGDSGTGVIIGIFVVFSIVQFVESYLLEPFIVGHEVDVNPVMIIVGVVLGGIVWGIMGMLLAIPLLGILKVIFDNVESLRPLGYALDERGISTGNGKQDKVKKWLMDKIKKAGNKKKR